MREILMTTLGLIMVVLANAQQWNGAANSTSSIYRSGPVGIGTTAAPLTGSALELYGGGDLVIRAASNNDAGDLIFMQNNQSQMGRIWTYSDGSFYMSSSDNLPDVTISGTGKIGLGTITPEARLHVQNDAMLSGTPGASSLLMKVGNSCSTCNTNTFQSNLWLRRDNSGFSGWQSVRLHDGISIDNSYLQPGTDTKTWWERSPYQDIQSWGTATNTYMTIKAGSVGIGTTSPDATLTVNGTIHGKEVKVDLTISGPDYVFEKDYALPSLESIQAYIDQNKHLPEVPSAKEMEANGINLSEMNMLLLKKVEELTLYVIELKKEIREIKSTTR